MADRSIDLKGVNLGHVKEKTQPDLASTHGVKINKWINKLGQCWENTICLESDDGCFIVF